MLDEIEKAHPDVANILLQALDDGRITDSQGRNVNFSNTVIIMTSNIGSSYLLEANEQTEQLVTAALRQHFKPELLNRVDDIITFHALTDEHFYAITWKYVRQLQERIAEQEITVNVDEAVVHWAVKEGVDAQFGARPLKRFVQRHIETAVAKALLQGDVLPGDTLEVTLENNAVHIEKS